MNTHLDHVGVAARREGISPVSYTHLDVYKRQSWGRVGNLSSIGLNYKSALLKKSSWTEQAQYGPEANNCLLYTSRCV